MNGDRSVAGETGTPGPRDPSRRTFLKVVGVTAGAASVSATLPSTTRRREDPTTQELAEEHANDPAMLIDLTKCVGCGQCVIACKADNQLEWREDQPAKGPDAALASSNYSVVRAEGRIGHDGAPRYVKLNCMHCLEPSCVSACFVRALQKSETGAVLYDGDRCVGCRYCQMACPFSVPTFEWDETFGRISKCDFCADRLAKGQPTACAEACTKGAITFGTRDELLSEAWRRIGAASYLYVPHVYGETEVGGTSVLYVSDVPFEELGFRTELPDTPLPEYTWKITRLLPPVAGGIFMGLMAAYIHRRRAFLDENPAARLEAGVSAHGADDQEEVEP
jgi:formate dehydrogenase iron-sulfur subunit